MVKCPICGKEVTTPPIKAWDLNPNVRVELYECCGKRFRQIAASTSLFHRDKEEGECV
jgi:hypothetical protein